MDHAYVNIGCGVSVHAERVARVERGRLITLVEAAADRDEDAGVTDDDDDEDDEPPAMAEDIAEVSRFTGDPAPVACDGLDVISGNSNGPCKERHEPDEGADEVLLIASTIHHPRTEVDGEQCCEGDGENGEVGGLNRHLTDPSIQIAGQSRF